MNEKNNEGIKTKIFTELESRLQKIDRRRVAGIIIITDGIIHDLEKLILSMLIFLYIFYY